MARFSAVPEIDQSAISTWQGQVLVALKENVDLLTGARGEPGGGSQAVTRASLTVAPPAAQTMKQVTARGQGYTISGVSVPSIEDYSKLVTDVQKLSNDVSALRATVETLIRQLRS